MRQSDASYQRTYRTKHKEAIAARAFASRLDDPRKSILRAAKSRATNSQIPFDLTVDDIVIPELCPYLGIPLFIAKGRATQNSPALDRIVPELGYIRGNVQVISHQANMMKNNAAIDQLLIFAESVIRLHS